MIRRVVFPLFVVGVLGHPALGQQAAPSVLASPQAPAIGELADLPPPPPKPVDLPRTEDLARKAEAKKSITRLNPLPRRASSASEPDPIARRDELATRGRYANPGGVGRYAEYYTANTLASQVGRPPTTSARFGGGGVPDRSSQIAAFQAGQSRARNIQNNINAYARPSVVYGFGYGGGLGFGLGGGGRLYGFPN
jgi:hypothetical protein